MANTKSAKKAVRKLAFRTAVNKARRTRMRTEIRRVEEAIAAGDQAKALEALSAAAPVIARSAQKGIIHKNTGSRKISRLTHRVKAMSQPA
jgi:small subunit ribosomal protein S20